MSGMIGGDLEFAVKTPTGNYIPAGVLPINGRKGRPQMTPTGGIEIDCCAVELTFPPANSEDGFTNNILNHLMSVRERYNSYGELCTTPSVKFDQAILERTRFANEMGCEPDFNVWTHKVNPKPMSSEGLRTFGGHIHIEFGNQDTIKACDLTLGLWSVVHDMDSDRRKLYGKAGAYREKPYGVEYRVLSNFWCGSERLIRQVYKLTQKAKELSKDIDIIVKTVGGADVIQNTINNSRIFDSKNILKTIGVDYELG